MTDVEWLKALALARPGPDGFTPDNPDAIRNLTRARIDDVLFALREEAETACSIFNQYARRERAIRLVPLANDRGGGFILLSGRAQLTLVREGDSNACTLVASLLVTRGFERRHVMTRRFTPCSDAFGSVVWMQDNALLMQNDLIIKRLMEDLSRGACEESE